MKSGLDAMPLFLLDDLLKGLYCSKTAYVLEIHLAMPAVSPHNFWPKI